MSSNKTSRKESIALGIALLFHTCGLAGMLFTAHKEWFIKSTPVTLVLMFLLVLWVQEKKSLFFWIYLLIAFSIGLFAEMAGVHTGVLFGDYSYGTVLGPGFAGVPLLIGINWFLVTYGAASIMQRADAWTKRKYEEAGIKISTRLSYFSYIADAALLATFFDWLMEPVAAKLGFWQWKDDVVPPYNYLCWYLLSFLLMIILKALKPFAPNLFALHLFIIQALFFLALRTFL